MANKTKKQFGVIVYFLSFLAILLLPISVYAAPYGEGDYGDCEYSEGCDTTAQTDSGDGTGNTDDGLTDPNPDSTTTDEDEDDPKKKTDDDEDDENIDGFEEEFIPAGEDEDGTGEDEGFPFSNVIAFTFLIFAGVGILWWLIAAKRRKRRESEFQG